MDTSDDKHAGNIPATAWQPLSNFKQNRYIADSWITKAIYLKFTLFNNTDTSKKMYFIGGMYVKSTAVFKVQPGRQPLQLKNESRMNGFQPIEVDKMQQQEFIVRLEFSKRKFNSLAPRVIAANHLLKYQVLIHYRYDAQPAVGYLLGGILLMMTFFTGANYLQSKKKEFLYNCCYSICMFGLIFLNTYLERKSGLLSSLFHGYLDFILLAIGTVFYVAFTRMFLDTKNNYPLLNRLFIYEERLIVGVVIFFTIIVFFTDLFALQKFMENAMKIMVLLIGIAFIVIAFTQKDKLWNYLAIGNALLIFFSIVSLIMILYPFINRSILSSSMLYYELGIVSELIFFLLGLSYKNRVELIEKIKEQESLKREAEKQSYETKLAVLNAQQAERNRISADMHDDLGAGVTAIRLYSELAKKRIGKEVIPEIERISSSANELLNNMNAIIWTMTSSNDTLDNMIAYIRSYALEYLENTGIRCMIHIEDDLPSLAVSGEIRRNIFMVVKEALNNILKHSGATEVNIRLKKENHRLFFIIHDNGRGINFEKLRRFGNGLINMKKRMDESQVTFTIENREGTLITLQRELPD